MRIISSPISLEELKEMASPIFGNLVKAVVDVEKGIMAINGELHADEEALLDLAAVKRLFGELIYIPK